MKGTEFKRKSKSQRYRVKEDGENPTAKDGRKLDGENLTPKIKSDRKVGKIQEPQGTERKKMGKIQEQKYRYRVKERGETPTVKRYREKEDGENSRAKGTE